MRRKGTDDDEGNAAATPALTVREEEILHWVVREKENAEVAQIAHVSPDTVRKHVENIRRKYGSESRVGVISSYWQQQVDERDRVIERLERENKGRK